MAVSDKSLAAVLANEPAYRAELQIALEELARTRAELRWLEQRHFALVEALEEGVVLLDERGRVTTVNPSARALVGSDAAVRRWIWGEDHSEPEVHLHPAAETLIDGRPRSGIELAINCADGSQRWVSVSARAVFDMDTGRVAAVVCSFSDISMRKSLQIELERQATIDPLTGAYNRRYLEKRLSAEVSRARRSRQPLSLMLADLDYFKQVNDRFGHAVGDLALQRFAEVLMRTLRAEDVVARLGGDEFCMLLPGTSARFATIAAERCIAALQAIEVESGGQRLRIAGTFGIAELGPAMTPIDLTARADEALYRAKAAGRGRAMVA